MMREHIKHRELYYHGPEESNDGLTLITTIQVARGFDILEVSSFGVLIRQPHDRTHYSRIPWTQVIQFTYWHDDDIGKDVP